MSHSFIAVANIVNGVDLDTFPRMASNYPLHQLHHDGVPHSIRLGSSSISPATVLE